MNDKHNPQEEIYEVEAEIVEDETVGPAGLQPWNAPREEPFHQGRVYSQTMVFRSQGCGCPGCVGCGCLIVILFFIFVVGLFF